MSGFSAVNYALAKKMDLAIQSGLLSATTDNVNKTITFKFNNGSTATLQFDQPSDGATINNITIDANNHFIFSLSDGTIIDSGVLPHIANAFYDNDNKHLYFTMNNGNIVDSGVLDIDDGKIGEWNDLTIQNVSTVVQALNKLDGATVNNIEYLDKKFIIKRKNGATAEIDVSTSFNDTLIQDLKNVAVSNLKSGDVLAWSETQQKFINAEMSTTDQFVKMSASDDGAKYLAELIDDETIKNANGKLEVEKIKGQMISVDELNTLLGMDANVKETLNAIASGGMVFKDVVPTKADLPSGSTNGFVYIVNVDESDNNNRNAYIYSDDISDYILIGTSGLEVRNFETRPLNIENETYGILPKDRYDREGLLTRELDVINSITYPIPSEDMEKVPSLQCLKQINEEVRNALGSKVNTVDIVDNLESTAIDKPLSANQGLVLNTKISETNNALEEFKQAFSDGVDLIYNACIEMGATPVDKSPVEIKNAILSITSAGEKWKQWLQKGGITTSYSSIDMLFNDTATLNQLMNNTDAIEFMKTWLKEDSVYLNTFIANKNVMEQIGLSNQCTDTLLADEIYKNVLLNCDNWRYILKDNVPKMISGNKSEDGLVKCSANYNAGGAWIAFDKDKTKGYSSQTNAGGDIWVSFPKPICIKKVLYHSTGQINSTVKTVRIYGQNDGGSKVLLGTFNTAELTNHDNYFDLSANDQYFTRIYLNSANIYGYGWTLWTAQEIDFFGRYQNE